MPDISAIAGALSAFQAAKNIAQAMIGLRDAAAFQSKMIEFQSAILDAQNASFAANEERATLIERIGKLEKEVARLEAWDAQKQRYQMRALSRHGASIAYALKRDAAGTEPFHCICAVCYEQGKREILQFSRVAFVGSQEHIIACPVCRTEVHTDRWPPEAAF